MSHDIENKLNRELILRGNEALEFINLYNRSLDDHENFTSKIGEKDIYNVYYEMTKDFKSETCGIQSLVESSTLENRLVYSNKSLVSLFIYFTFQFS